MPTLPTLPPHNSPYLSPLLISDRSATGQSSNSSSPVPSSFPVYIHDPANLEKKDGYDPGDTAPTLRGSIISPAITPPAIRSSVLSQVPTQIRSLESIDQEHILTTKKRPRLLERLPRVECVVRARIPTTAGAEMFLHLYQNDVDNKEHLAIVFGNDIRSQSLDRIREGETEMDRMIRGAYVGRLRPGRVSSRYDEAQIDTPNNMATADKYQKLQRGHQGAVAEARNEPKTARSTHPQAPLVRIHSECYTGETAWSARCDCGEQLDEAARLMSGLPASSPFRGAPAANSPPTTTTGGVIIYLRQEGRGIGLGEKLKAYNLQDLGSDTVEANLLLRHPADARSYGLATAMLVDLGLGADSNPEGIRLLTNNPDKVHAIEGPDREVRVKERVPMIPLAWRTGGKKGINSTEIESYLRTKIGKMGHLI